MAQHPREHVVRKQADIVAKHAEDESVDEVRTTCGSCPRARNAWATDANDAAARSVSDCRVSLWVSPGRRRSGSENATSAGRTSTRQRGRRARSRAFG